MEKEKRPGNKKALAKKIICGAISTILCGAIIVGDVISTRPNMSHTITAYFGGGLNVTDEELKQKSYDNAKEVSKSIAQEGIVLLKNENNALPLEGVDKVNLFGYDSAHTFISGTGSSGVDGSAAASFKDAFANVGITINNDLYEKYAGYGDGSLPSNFSVVEPEITDADFYSDDLWSSYEAYSDVAIMVIGRKGGEGADLAHNYLTISKNEQDLLTQLEERFEKVFVLVNSGNAMEMGFLDDERIDGALLINYTGNNGTEAVTEIMTGAVNPSGKTVDTYAYDHKSSPSYYSSGIEATRQYTGIDANAQTGKGYYYIDYTDGIYVGYRYYETRFVNNETGQVDEVAYKKTVQYPFGYGLSYTNFEQKIVSQKGSITNKGADEISVTVNVTNTGSIAGKDIVELYATPPYTVGGIEKSAVNLVGYAKTNELQPGESQEVTVTINVDDLASYDYNDANSNAHKGYEIEAGDYVLSIRSDAHTVLDTVTLNAAATYYFDTDSTTGNEVTNQFDDGAGDKETENITYLSRADWEGTWNSGDGKETTLNYDAKEGMTAYTIEYAQGRSASEAVLNSTNEYLEAHYADNDDTAVEMPTTGANNKLTISDMKGLDYDDPLWDDLLDELTVKDMQNLIGSGAMGIGSNDNIALAQTAANDGTCGITAAYGYNGGTSTDSCYAYPNETMVASTWNEAMAYAEGEAVAMEADACNVTTWYAPGANIHRTPYGGRNCDYYSEDGLISGNMSANVIKGGQDNDMTVMIKHFAINEQETARNVDGLYTWVTEQAMREIYLKPFEVAVKEGGCKAIMSSFNRIGATWTGNSYALLTTVLRDEWGFVGMVNTDAYVPMEGGDATFYMTMNSGIRAGNDIWLQGLGDNVPSIDKNDAYTVSVMRENCHNILYSIAEGRHIAQDTSLQKWQIGLIALNIGVFGLSALAIYLTFFRKKKKLVEINK